MNKQFLIVKVAHEIGQAVNLIPLPGLFTLGAAEQMVKELARLGKDEAASLMIQEVGAA